MRLTAGRLLFDLAAVALLLGVGYAMQLFGLNTSMFAGFCVPVGVAFGRGFAERRFLANASSWMAVTEWIAIVFITHLAGCYLAALLWPYQNFATVFGFTVVIILIPTILLSTVSYCFGMFLAVRVNRDASNSL